MKRYIIHIYSLLCTLLLATACTSREEVHQEATLEVAQAVVELAQASSTTRIEIKTNQANWSYMIANPEEWLTIERDGYALIVSVSANTDGKERSTSILVRAGDAHERILVRQQASQQTGGIIDQPLEFASAGGEQMLSLEAYGKSIALEPAQETPWIVLRRITSTTYHLRVLPQPEIGAERRTAKLLVSSGDALHEIVVVQQAQPFYMLPLMGSKLTLAEMMAQEEARGSQLIRRPGGNNLRFYHFSPNRNVGAASIIEYDYPFADDVLYFKASVLYKGLNDFDGNEAFEAYLTAQGFVKDSNGEGDVFGVYHRDIDRIRFVLTASRINGRSDTRVELRPQLLPETNPEEPKPKAKTFTTMPLAEQTAWLGSRAFKKKSTKTGDEVKKLETDRGSKPNEEATTAYYLFYDVVPTEANIEVARGYLLVGPGPYWADNATNVPADDPYIGNVEGIIAGYEDIGLVYEQGAGGQLTITDEAKAFFAAHGAPFARRIAAGTANQEDIFLNRETSIMYRFKVETYRGKRLLSLRVSYGVLPER